MKKLQKLFSARALATTLAAGMLLHSAVVALADDCISVSAVTPNPGSCTYGQPYVAEICNGNTYWYCCDDVYHYPGGGLGCDTGGVYYGLCCR